jgi:hypothetical protein
MAGMGHNQKVFVSINGLSEADKKRVKDAVLEMNDSMTRIAAERDLQKDTLARMEDQLGIDKKMLRRMARVYFKSNYAQEQDENRNFEEMYDGVMK